MIEIVLVEPRIAMNTGNIVRACANTGARLHLVEPLGFTLDDASLRRGGLDYHELTEMRVWSDWRACRSGLGEDRRWFATTARPPGRRYDEVAYAEGDVVVFGGEPSGLPERVLSDFDADRRIGIPMRPNNRSLNLAGAVHVVAFEAWRQRGFDGAVFGTTEESRPAIAGDESH